MRSWIAGVGLLVSLVLPRWVPLEAAGPRMVPPSSGSAVVIPNARLMNIYWDADWDAHVGDPRLGRAHIDAFMQALVQSEYFAGLVQYGVQTVSYEGSAEPAPACGSTSPSSLTAQTIAQLVDCQARHGQLSGSLVNVFLPPTTIQDSARPAALCGGDPRYRNLYSYHGSTQRGGGVAFTVIASLCAINYTRNHTYINGALGFLTVALTHEIVEALTNPFASGWRDRGKELNASEVADICEPAAYGTFRTAPIPLAEGALTAYWSNQDTACVFGKAR